MSRKDDKDKHAVVKKQLKSAIEQLENIFKELNKSKTLSEAITSLENKNKEITASTNTIREKLKEELENRKPVLDFGKKSLEKVKIIGFISGKPFEIIKCQVLLRDAVAHFVKKITSVDFLIPAYLNKAISDEDKKSLKLENINLSQIDKISKRIIDKVDDISRETHKKFRGVTDKI